MQEDNNNKKVGCRAMMHVVSDASGVFGDAQLHDGHDATHHFVSLRWYFIIQTEGQTSQLRTSTKKVF